MFSAIKRQLRKWVGAENLEFLGHTKNYLSASLIQNVLLAISIPLFTQLLSPGEYGVLSIFTSLVTLLTIVFGLNMRSGIVRYYLEKRGDFDLALGNNILFLVLFNILSFFVIYLFNAQLAAFCVIDEEVFLYASLVAVFSVSLELYLSYLQGSKQSGRYAVLMVLRKAVALGVAVVLILQLRENKHLGKMYADLIITGLLSAYAYYILISLSKFKIDLKYIRYTMRFSIPLIPHAMSRFILGYFDRIIIKQLTTAAETGIYSFAYDVGKAMDVIVMATVRAWRPIFFDEYREKNYDKLNRMAYDYANYIYLAAIAVILFSTDLVTLLADEEYFSALRLVPIIVMGYVFVFLYTLFFQYSSYRKRTELISLNTFIAGFVNIATNYWLIPIYGYQAAAYTTLGSFALLFFLHFINAKYVLKENVISLRKLLPNFSLVIVVAVGHMYLTASMDSYLLFLGIRIVALALAAWYFLTRKKADGGQDEAA